MESFIWPTLIYLARIFCCAGKKLLPRSRIVHFPRLPWEYRAIDVEEAILRARMLFVQQQSNDLLAGAASPRISTGMSASGEGWHNQWVRVPPG
jgi:hypothetical protein